MPSSDNESQRVRPLLIIISRSDAVSADLRSRTRDVWRWHAASDGRSDAGSASQPGVRSDVPDAGSGDAGGRSFRGDPTDPDTYEWVRAAPSVTAVIDLDAAIARQVLNALRRVRPDAAVMLLSPGADAENEPGDGTLARRGRLRDVLRVDVEEELERLEAERRGYCLKEFAAGPDVVPILIHNDPDPDAVSSALAVAELLGGSAERTPIVTLDPMTRPENRRMAALLRISVTEITRDELMRFDRVITVDTQPNGMQHEGRPRFAVIDHHPPEEGYTTEFKDIRPHYGATATMMTEYLRAIDESLINSDLATALLFGIRTDTDALMRGVTAADVAAYAWLQIHADVQLIRRFERPSYSRRMSSAFGNALAGAEYDDELIVVHLGELRDTESHVLADLADFCLTIENITWVIAAAEIESSLVLTLRHAGKGPGAGTLARAIAQMGGDGGGHETMARAVLPMGRARELLEGEPDVPAIRRFVRRVMAEGSSTSRRGLRPAHPA
ncbi:MAG: DHH family phosphoesterase [Gemmatimonadetes bacterium]|nr:DHH family phosphoesterase [Gemmatimonadota bacterium]